MTRTGATRRDRGAREGAERPLRGRGVLVTRPERQAGALSSRLEALGAEVLEVPTIRIQDPPDREPLLGAVRNLSAYDWIVLTSVNGVRKLEEAMEASGVGPEAAAGAAVAAIGPATAEAARRAGLSVGVIPDRYRAEALVEAIRAAAGAGGAGGDRPLAGRRILLPRAAEARSVLPEGLEAAGASVDEVPAYVTLPARGEAAELRRLLEAGRVDWITFTASSTVRSFVELAGTRIGRARVAAIGPITAGTAREEGLRVDAVAEEYTVSGLVRALVAAAGRGDRTPPAGSGGGSEAAG